MKPGDKPQKPDASPRAQPPLNLMSQFSMGQMPRTASMQNDSQSLGTAYFGANSAMGMGQMGGMHGGMPFMPLGSLQSYPSDKLRQPGSVEHERPQSPLKRAIKSA